MMKLFAPTEIRLRYSGGYFSYRLPESQEWRYGKMNDLAYSMESAKEGEIDFNKQFRIYFERLQPTTKVKRLTYGKLF